MPISIWLNGNDWQDFYQLFHQDEGIYTVLTQNGTCHVFNLDEGWRMRVPNFHKISNDGMKIYWSSISLITSCGYFTKTMLGETHISTHILGIWEGECVDAAQKWYASNPTLIPTAPNHQEEHCGAYYCVKPNPYK